MHRWSFHPRAHRILPRAAVAVAARAGFGDEWENYGSTTYSYVGFLRPSCKKIQMSANLSKTLFNNSNIMGSWNFNQLGVFMHTLLTVPFCYG